MELMAHPAGMESMGLRVPMVNRAGMAKTVLMGLRVEMVSMVPQVTRVIPG
jgi:hypothetical protein